MTTHPCIAAIDVHVHAVPPALLERVGRGEFPGIELSSNGTSSMLTFVDMASSPPVPLSMTSAAALAASSAAQHVALQLLGPWTDFFGYTLPETVAVDWCRAYNIELVEMCAGNPHQLPMATIPLIFPSRAVAELHAARALGCHGVMIGTDLPGGLHLGSAELDPVWEAAAALDMPVLLHPTRLDVPGELNVAGLKNAVGRAEPTAIALTRLLYAGVLNRHPELSFIACHGGGGFAAVAPRVLRNHEIGWSETDVDVQEGVSRLYFDSVVLDPRLLGFLVEVYGADRFVLGSDLPFPWEPHPVATLIASDLGADATASIAHKNARQLYRLPSVPRCPACSA
ncbi:amidohydrolase family protein [Nocardioides conyzicola]|uniref:2-amino-3-carboxymuconate-6-semialdehyde decarboxylase n=1 Tax=Nocardioides conyzicola TaxID=1651781 RepID=A0ABP8X476_9ACTN